MTNRPIAMSINARASVARKMEVVNKIEEIIKREGYTDFHLNQISVNQFGGVRWQELTLDKQEILLRLLRLPLEEIGVLRHPPHADIVRTG